MSQRRSKMPKLPLKEPPRRAWEWEGDRPGPEFRSMGERMFHEKYRRRPRHTARWVAIGFALGFVCALLL